MAATARYRLLFEVSAVMPLVGTKIDIEYDQNANTAQLALGMDACWDWWDLGVQGEAAAKTLFPSSVELEVVTGQSIIPVPPGGVSTDDRAGIPGTRVGQALPPQVSAVVSFSTEVSERRQRGRMYLPPFVEGDVGNAGDMQTAFVQDVVDVVRSLALELESAARLNLPNTDAEHVIVSQALLNPPRPAANFPVTRYRMNTRADTQRRRNSLVGQYISAS